mmetsp:Transcript_21897/g.57156  ORF Transcript_21897/g.57156 Transcript_21897/m.57156 type:complete len:285 (+) Transcript_21897:778-1632(+)
MEVRHPPRNVNGHQNPTDARERTIREKHLPHRPVAHQLHHHERPVVRGDTCAVKDEQIRVSDLLHEGHLPVKVLVGQPAHVVVERHPQLLDSHLNVAPPSLPHRPKRPARQYALKHKVILTDFPRSLHLNVLGIQRLLLNVLVVKQLLVQPQVVQRRPPQPVQPVNDDADNGHKDHHANGDARLVRGAQCALWRTRAVRRCRGQHTHPRARRALGEAGAHKIRCVSALAALVVGRQVAVGVIDPRVCRFVDVSRVAILQCSAICVHVTLARTTATAEGIPGHSD